MAPLWVGVFRSSSLCWRLGSRRYGRGLAGRGAGSLPLGDIKLEGQTHEANLSHLERCRQRGAKLETYFEKAVEKQGWRFETVVVPRSAEHGGDVRVHLQTPVAGVAERLPLVVWLHGGGMTMMSAKDM